MQRGAPCASPSLHPLVVPPIGGRRCRAGRGADSRAGRGVGSWAPSALECTTPMGRSRCPPVLVSALGAPPPCATVVEFTLSMTPPLRLGGPADEPVRCVSPPLSIHAPTASPWASLTCTWTASPTCGMRSGGTSRNALRETCTWPGTCSCTTRGATPGRWWRRICSSCSERHRIRVIRICCGRSPRGWTSCWR